MTEEEVNAKFLEMNKDLFNNKLNIDLDRYCERLIEIFNNIITAYQKDMSLRIYEISFDAESILSREDIDNKLKNVFGKIIEYIKVTVNKNKEFLITDLNNKDMDKYNSDIDLYGNELIKGISELYLKEITVLLKDLYRYMDSYSNARLDKIIKEIIYNHFIEKSKDTVQSSNTLLKNNIYNNTTYLENMNKSTVKQH